MLYRWANHPIPYLLNTEAFVHCKGQLFFFWTLPLVFCKLEPVDWYLFWNSSFWSSFSWSATSSFQAGCIRASCSKTCQPDTPQGVCQTSSDESLLYSKSASGPHPTRSVPSKKIQYCDLTSVCVQGFIFLYLLIILLTFSNIKKVTFLVILRFFF